MDDPISWDDVWNSVHNFLCTNETVSAIWHQLHLNFYTQYSYNKWHKVDMMCPLCEKSPESIFHLILHCDVVIKLWDDISEKLLRLHPTPITKEEMALGIVTKKETTGSTIRNWLTYTMRKCIGDMEREAFYSRKSVAEIKAKIQGNLETEMDKKLFAYAAEGKIDKFEKFFAHENVICTRTGNHSFDISKLFS